MTCMRKRSRRRRLGVRLAIALALEMAAAGAKAQQPDPADIAGHLGRDPLIGWPLIIFGGVAAVGAYVLHYTVLGRYIYAIGGNREAARYSGINVNRVELLTYVISAGTAGIAGVSPRKHWKTTIRIPAIDSPGRTAGHSRPGPGSTRPLRRF